MLKLIKQLLIGPALRNPPVLVPPSDADPADDHPKSNRVYLSVVWHEKRGASTFGIERITRILLVLTTFISLGLFIRGRAGRDPLRRKLATEAYVITKTLAPVAFLLLYSLLPSLNHHYLFVILLELIALYLTADTVLYTLGLLFLSDIYGRPTSAQRTYLLTVLNYLALCLSFAFLYRVCGGIKDLNCTFDAVYFSFITAFTIGYGDMYPLTRMAKLLVLIHASCSFLLVSLVFTHVVNGFKDRNPVGSDHRPPDRR